MAYRWLEAEAFDTLGGWVVEQQSIESMGSAYVMAHGLGVPVADATTRVLIPEGGSWTVWVRTRDWTAVWQRGHAAGVFRVLIDGMALPATLGTNGPAWGWQEAGKVHLAAGEARLALHDLTGFNARCDALYLTTDPQERPPDAGTELAAFRRQRSGTVTRDDPVLYHFKELGHLSLAPSAVSAKRLADPALQQRIRALGVTHRRPHPELDADRAE